MGVTLLVLLLALFLGGLGFALRLLWIVAAIVFVFWLVGFRSPLHSNGDWLRVVGSNTRARGRSWQTMT